MEEMLKPGIPYYILVGIAGLGFFTMALYSMSLRRDNDPRANLFSMLALTVFFFFAMLWDIRYPLVAGFVGGFGVVFLVLALLEVIKGWEFPFPWWAALISFGVGVWLLQIYPSVVKDWPEFLQGFSMMVWGMVIVMLVGAGGLYIMTGILDRLWPPKQ